MCLLKNNYLRIGFFIYFLPDKEGKEKKMKKTKMLKKNYEFRTVLSKGTYFSGKYIEAFIKKNHKNNNFLGIAISVKIAKAVKRNHIKRLLRECYCLEEDNIKNGYIIVFLWKKKVDIKNATFENIQKDVKYIIDKSGILEENK